MKKGGFHSETPVHDPAIYLDKDGTYYIFGSHMAAATSKDLRKWDQYSNFVSPENPLFEGLFDKKEAFAFTGKFGDGNYAVWAPDVSYNPYLKKYVMYFCTTASYMKSTLCMATADEAKGPYRFQARLMSSGFDRETVKLTDLYDVLGEDADLSVYLHENGEYNNLKWPNCIDPNTFHDEDGRFWMVYGSWSGGIFLIELDEHTGLPIHPATDREKDIDAYYGYKLMGGGHKSIEGPYIFYDKVSGYYYLFVSFGWLEREGGYQIRLFRARKPQGPYLDQEGRNVYFEEDHAPFGLKLMGNYDFPSLEMAYRAPGHNSAFEDTDGKLYVVYHQRFDMQWEIHEPRVHELFRTADGWLTASPFATVKEEQKDKRYTAEEIEGTYYVLDHERDIDKVIHTPRERVFGTDITFETREHAQIRFTVDGRSFEGVVIEMVDEAENPVLCISGVGENRSIWAVRYL